MQLFLDMTINGVVLATSIMLIGIGFMLLHSILRIDNLAQGEMFMLAAMLTWYFTIHLHISYAIAIIISIIIVILLGILIEKYTFRKFRGDLLSSLILSMGLVFILQRSSLLVFGIETKKIPPVFPGIVSIGGVQLAADRIVVSLISLVTVVGLVIFVKLFKAGWGMRALAQDENAARLQGVSLKGICILTAALASAIAAIAGGLSAPLFVIYPGMGFPLLLKGLVAITIGGLGSMAGAILGSLIVGLVESYISTVISIEISQIVLFGILSFILIVKPSGIFGNPFER